MEVTPWCAEPNVAKLPDGLMVEALHGRHKGLPRLLCVVVRETGRIHGVGLVAHGGIEGNPTR